MLNVALIQFDASLLTDVAFDLGSIARPVVGWTHCNRDVPDFYSLEDKTKVIEMWPFWRMVNSKVEIDGPLPL